MQLKQDGKNYLNGWGGKPRNYAKAKECFNKAKELGAQDVDPWIKICDSNLNKSKAKPVKKAPKKRK